MNILWLITLPFVSNIIYGIAGNETLRVEVRENEPSSETERAIRTIPANDDLSKVTKGEVSDTSPACSKTIENDIAQNHCLECNVTFRYDTHYVKHCKNVHGIKPTFPCGYCKREFGIKRCLTDHMNKAHGLKKHTFTRWKKNEPIACDECRETVHGWTKFEQHALSKHAGIKMMSCSHCKEKFFRRKYALRHEKMEHGDAEVKCEICKNIFERSDLLKEHLEFCEQRQIQKKMGDKQVDTIVRFEMIVCEECGDEHKNFSLLRDHFRSKHPHLKLHHCDHCAAAFSDGKTLEKHVDMVHPDKTAGKMISRKKFNRGAVYTCEYCEEIIAGTSKYEKHGKSHPGLPMFRCKDCGKGFSTRKTLSNHANELHGEVKKRCRYCSKCYFRLWTHEKDCKKKIEKRERKRMEGYPKQYCGLCSQVLYMTDLTFRNHVNQHKYLESCAICGQRFRRGKGGLDKHVERKHPLRENIEALLRTADEFRTYAKKEEAAYIRCNNSETIAKGFYDVKTEKSENVR